MPKTLRPQNIFRPTIEGFPTVGDPVSIAPLEAAIQAVLDRTENLHQWRQEMEAAKGRPGGLATLDDSGRLAQDVRDGSIGTAHITDGAVTTPKIADGAITRSKLASGAIDTTILPDIGNYGRWVMVYERTIWGDAATSFVVEIRRADGWLVLPRVIYAPNLDWGGTDVRSGWKRRYRFCIQYVDNTRNAYDPNNRYWDGGAYTAKPWMRLLDHNSGNELWAAPMRSTWGNTDGTRECWLDIPEDVSNHAFGIHTKIAIGLWWDANTPSWPTANIPGDNVPNNYRNYGSQVWLHIHRIALVAYDVMP